MTEQQAIIVLKALADPTRLDIVRTLASEQSAASCREVSNCSQLSQPALSHHFGKLVEAGVVVERKEGKQKFYQLNMILLDSLGINPKLL